MENEILHQIVKLYESRRLLWNSKHPDYYNKNKREDLWREISVKVNVPVDDLKKKMTSLLGSYRREKSREKEAGLLKPLEVQTDGDDEDEDCVVGTAASGIPDEPDTVSAAQDIGQRNPSAGSPPSLNGPPSAKKRKADKATLAEIQTEDSWKPTVQKDECYHFCELLRLKLRGLDQDSRDVAMHEISHLMFHLKRSGSRPVTFQQGMTVFPFSSSHYSPAGTSSSSHPSPLSTPCTAHHQELEDTKVEEC